MAVVPMKLLNISGPEAQAEDVICICLINEKFDPTEITRSGGSSSGQEYMIPYGKENTWKQLLSRCESLLSSLEIPLAFEDFRKESYTQDSVSAFIADAENHVQQYQQQIEALRQRVEENKKDISELDNFLTIPSNLEDLYHLEHIALRFGRMPRENYDSLALKQTSIDSLLVYPTNSNTEYTWLVYAVPKSERGRADMFMNSLGFEKLRLTSHTFGSPIRTRERLEKDTEESSQKLTALQAEDTSWKEANRTKLLAIYSYVRFLYEAQEILHAGAHTSDGAFVLNGWAPVDAADRITSRLAAFPDVLITVEDPESAHGEEPPVLLKNNFWARLFQPFIEMYGLPKYNEFDPTFLMAVTYSILFGMMYGDVGQGLCLVALGIFLYKKGQWLGGILGSVGVFSTIFGFLYGSVFGNEDLLPGGFHVLEKNENATEILIISAVIGAVLIILMMVINIINGIRQKNPEKIFFTNNSIAGMVFYAAVLIGAVLQITQNVKIFSAPYVIFLIVLPLLLIFCAEPLGKLAAHRKDWKPESVGGFVTQQFFELFEVILSYVTNTVSYLRVGAYAICHAGMMLVVYRLAGSNIPGLMVGNIIVMAIEGLMVCIQVLRLEFYEMFGRFYESGGKKFVSSEVDFTKPVEM